MRQRARTDGNQVEIVAAFRGLGCSVTVTSRVGEGFPDLVVGVESVTVPVEIKMPGGTLTDEQETWFKLWRGSKAVVRTLEDVGILVKAIRAFAGRAARKEGRANRKAMTDAKAEAVREGEARLGSGPMEQRSLLRVKKR